MFRSIIHTVTNRDGQTVTLPAVLIDRKIRFERWLTCILASLAVISQIPKTAIGAENENAIHYGDTIYLATNGGQYWLTGTSRPPAITDGDGQFLSNVYTNQNSRGHVAYEWTIHDTMSGSDKSAGAVRLGDEVYLRDNGGGWLVGNRGNGRVTGMFDVFSCNATSKREQSVPQLYRWRIQNNPDTSAEPTVGSVLLPGQSVYLGCVWKTTQQTSYALLTGARNNGTGVHTNLVTSNAEKKLLPQYYPWKIMLVRKTRPNKTVTEHFARNAVKTKPDPVAGSDDKLNLDGYPLQVFHSETRIDATDTVYKDEVYLFPGNPKRGITPWKLPRSKVRYKGYWTRVYKNRVPKGGVAETLTYEQGYEVTKEQSDEFSAGLMVGFTAKASPFGIGGDATIEASLGYAHTISRGTSKSKSLAGEVTVRPGEQVEVWARRVDVEATWDWESAVRKREGLNLSGQQGKQIAQLSWFLTNCYANIYEKQLQDRVGGKAADWANRAKTDANIKSLYDQWHQYKFSRGFSEMMKLNKGADWNEGFNAQITKFQKLKKVHRYTLPFEETYTVRYKIDSIPKASR